MHFPTMSSLALLLVNNLPETVKWRFLAGSLRQHVEECNRTVPPTPISSGEFITSTSDEYHFHNKHNIESMAQDFTARYKDNKETPKPLKRTCPANPSPPSASLSKRPHVQKTCTNPSCGRKGHDTADCIAYGGAKQGVSPCSRFVATKQAKCAKNALQQSWDDSGDCNSCKHVPIFKNITKGLCNGLYA